MSSGRSIFASGIILGAALGFSAGHLTLWSRLDQRYSAANHPFSFIEGFDSGELRLAEPDFLPPDLGTPLSSLTSALAVDANPGATATPAESPDSSDPNHSPTVTALLDHSASIHSEALSANDQQLLPPAGNLLPRTEPPAIQAPDAVPLTEHDAAREKSIRELVEQELKDIPPLQQDVWFDSLRDLPHEDAANVLKMWKQFGGPSSSTLPVPQAQPPVPPLQPRSGSTPANTTSNSFPALQQARAILARNILNHRVPGYRQMIPQLQDVPLTAELQEALLTTRINYSQGALQPTSSPFDWAIKGEGYFVVTDGQKTFYTRAGHWTLDESRKLVLAGSQPPLALQVDWTIPADATTVSISSDGEVSITLSTPAPDGESDSPAENTPPEKTILGQIKLARFLNPNGLAPKSGILFAETPASGPAQLGIPLTHSFGSIKQGVLELSNVDIKAEQESIRHIDSLIPGSPNSR